MKRKKTHSEELGERMETDAPDAARPDAEDFEDDELWDEPDDLKTAVDQRVNRRVNRRRPGLAGTLAVAAGVLAAAFAALFFTGLLDAPLHRAVLYSGEDAKKLAAAIVETLPEGAGKYAVREAPKFEFGGYAAYALPLAAGEAAQRVLLPEKLINGALSGSLTAVDRLVAERFTAVSISLDPADVTLKEGETHAAAALFTPADTFDRTLAWSSADPAVATVGADGVVTAVAFGNTTITAATANGKSATLTVSVLALPHSIDLGGDTAVVFLGEEKPLTAKVLPENAVDNEVSWTSSDESIVRVDGGKLVGVALGTATVTASTANGVTAACKVEVQIAPTSVTLSETSVTLVQEETVTLTALVGPENATDKSVTWSSNNESSVKVEDGVLTTGMPGTAVVTATAVSGVSASCDVTVNKKLEEPKILRLVQKFIRSEGNIRLTLTTNGDTTSVKLYDRASGDLKKTLKNEEITAEDKTWTFRYFSGVHGGTYRFLFVAENSLGKDSSRAEYFVKQE